MNGKYYHLVIYVPQTHTDDLLNALFAAGAGKIGHYDRCAWRSAGTGQFRPLPGNDAFIGETMRDEYVAEDKVELLIPGTSLPPVLTALRRNHPYETPAFQYWTVEIE